LLLNTAFYPSIGGVENSLRGITESLIDSGFKVSIVSGDLSNIGNKYLPEKESIFGAEIHRYQSNGFFRRLISCYKICKVLSKENSYEIVISRSNITTLCAKGAGFKNLIYLAPAVYRFQDSPKNKGKRGRYYFKYLLNSLLEMAALSTLKKVFVFSSTMAEQIKAVKPSLQVIRVFPGVDTNRFFPIGVSQKQAMCKKLGLPDEKKIMLCLGRLEKVKGFDLAINAISYLSDNYYLVIVGEGSQKPYLQNLADQLKVEHKVYFESFTEKPERYYQASDIFLMTSSHEPLGQVILEALASGVTVVAPRSGESVQTATSEIAERLMAPIILCEKYEPKALAQAIESAPDVPDFTISGVELSWMSLYQDLKRNA